MADNPVEKIVSVTFARDEDIRLTYFLRDRKEHKKGSTTPRSSSHKRLKGDDGGETELNNEASNLLNENLPQEFQEKITFSDGLVGEQEVASFGFRTPKKSSAMQSKAQTSATKYNYTPNKLGTPSKVKAAEIKDPHDSTTTPSNRKSKTRISFGGEIGATPSKNTNNEGTPKSALRHSRKPESDDPKTPTPQQTKLGTEITPKGINKRLSLGGGSASKIRSARKSMAFGSMAAIEEKPEAIPQTPYFTRQRIKRSIQKNLKNELIGCESESEASDSEDDFKPESDQSSSDENSEESSESDEDEENSKQTLNCRNSMIVCKSEIPVTPSRSKRGAKEMTYEKDVSPQMDQDFREEKDVWPRMDPNIGQEKCSEIASDNYFERFGVKDVTSNNTLSRLRTPRLSEDIVHDLLKDLDIGHKVPLARLATEHRFLFNRWLFTLLEGYSVLLYGLGSKKHLLQNFHSKVLSSSQVLVVNGFFPGLTIKEVIDTTLTDLLGLRDIPTNPQEGLEIIEKIQRGRLAARLFFLVHNLDGPSLRNSKAQTILSKLAQLPNVHLIATVDHVNAPLMWDLAKLHRYNFAWWDATTFMPYSVETSFESSLLIQHSGALRLSSLHSVFKSLTSNAKKIYLMIAKHQLENSGNSSYTGLPFNTLYWSAREAFLVSTHATLRSQLTEFLDHHMVKQKRDHEASETLFIPIDNSILQAFVQSQEEKE